MSGCENLPNGQYAPEQLPNKFPEINTLLCDEVERQFASVPTKKSVHVNQQLQQSCQWRTTDTRHQQLP